MRKKKIHRVSRRRARGEQGALSLWAKLQKRTDLHNYGFDQSCTIQYIVDSGHSRVTARA